MVLLLHLAAGLPRLYKGFHSFAALMGSKKRGQVFEVFDDVLSLRHRQVGTCRHDQICQACIDLLETGGVNLFKCGEDVMKIHGLIQVTGHQSAGWSNTQFAVRSSHSLMCENGSRKKHST